MTELLQAAISPPNLLPTGLLVFVLLYWLTVLLGLLDMKTVDLSINDHGHVHFDSSTGHDGPGTGWLNGALAFFNLGRIPLMIFLSFVFLPLWAGSILLNYYTANSSLLLGLAFFLPLLVASLFVAKFLTLPFVKLFTALEKDHDAGAVVIGKVCTVLLPTTADHLGQASVRIDGAPLVLNVRSISAPLSKGETALVIDFDAQRKCYLIEPYATR
jgi:phosphoglycerol transferase MdoB-like AlkP superfamily enzyme